MESLKDQAAIVGIGETVYNRDSGRTELSLAVEAAKKAIADAGLETRDIDGMVKFTADSTSQGELAACLGIPYLRYYGAYLKQEAGIPLSGRLRAHLFQVRPAMRN